MPEQAYDDLIRLASESGVLHSRSFDTELLVVEGAAPDKRFADNPLVQADLHIRFYAGAPLVTPDGHTLGTLYVIDSQPRQLTAEQADALRALARQVRAQLELRRKVNQLEARAQRAARYQSVLLDLARSPGTVERLLKAGANSYLTKPLDVDDFLATLERTLNRTR